MAAAPPSPRGRRAGTVPAEPGLWVFVIGDMTIFAVLFGAFLVARGDAPAMFADGRHELQLGFGLANTLVLLTSSLAVALALHQHRAGRHRRASRLVLAAGVCSALFVGLKAVEWTAHVGQGQTPATDEFWTYYFLLTGLHLVHLVVGSIGLVVLHRTVRRSTARPHDRLLAEGAACYWHMVDLLWVVIFPLLYLAST